ncbi:Alpha-1,3-mannosyl-glycoprotein 4-beta-N-acetylglucosaminyltransferase C [Fusarium austroafricanum]|uniref:Alpha-1,3-mannosyl-glycoprotein 4-beta-N-acetylglucosaminyltransferase C n=1 Tax=Fusarium austroafricanum TaxID=2364996 RepID=A0A8H4P2H2_9HYPO|nr:Alpha-1,3-mannosyl-glycoprotein 4-beta-N-acetylglucosaminyltransferase C [Fusarium austroafricanum]
MLVGHNRRILVIYASLAFTWLILFQLCRVYTFSDPSSFFYDPRRAYQTRYTDIRESQADELLRLANSPTGDLSNSPLINNDSLPQGRGKHLCIGIPSVRRQREQFLPRALASLVEGLSPKQRSAIHIVVLLADDDPTSHPAFGQLWLDRLADEVLFYGNTSLDVPERYRNVTSTASGRNRDMSRNDRVHRDYSTLIATCQGIGVEYFALIEDDIIASRNWLGRLSTGLDRLEHTEDAANWLYLRLFYSETYMGWNSEEWRTYLVHALSIYCIVLVVYNLAIMLDMRRRRQVVTYKPSPYNIVHLTFWTASFIALYFLAGRLTVDPFPTGVHEMPNYGCCAQGLVIPHQHLGALESALHTASDAIAGDSLIESFADMRGLKKYAITPSVLQHVGIRGSSDHGSRKATWNFSFEKINTRASE